MKPRGSTATFEFRNRRRTKENFVAVEGLDTRGVRDKHVKKPKAKKKGQTKPHIAEKKIFGENNLSQGTGSSHNCAQNVTPQIFSDTAPITATQHTEGSTCKTVDCDMNFPDEGAKQRSIFIQPAETILRTMFQRGAVDGEPTSFQEKRGGQIYGDHEIGQAVKVHKVQTPYGENVMIGENLEEGDIFSIKDDAYEGCASSAEATTLQSAPEQAGHAQGDDGLMGDDVKVVSSKCDVEAKSCDEQNVSKAFSGDVALAERNSSNHESNHTDFKRARFARAPDATDGNENVGSHRDVGVTKPILVEVPRFQTGAQVRKKLRANFLTSETVERSASIPVPSFEHDDDELDVRVTSDKIEEHGNCRPHGSYSSIPVGSNSDERCDSDLTLALRVRSTDKCSSQSNFQHDQCMISASLAHDFKIKSQVFASQHVVRIKRDFSI